MNHHDQPEVWHFEALDTWFFKESRPLEAIGGAQLGSTFPPPASTLIGAIRSTLGEACGVNWHQYVKNEGRAADWQALIGTPTDLTPLSFQGPFLTYQKKRVFPAPLSLMLATVNDQVRYTHLRPADQPCVCDLGAVRLPQKQDKTLLGAKLAENHYLTEQGLLAVLSGQAPKKADVLKADALFDTEERLGIARDQATRRPLDGLLYQTCHIRPRSETGVAIVVQGLQQSQFKGLSQQGVVRLGGEGRLGAWQRQKVSPLPKPIIKGTRLLLCLLTHAAFEQGWLPDGFEMVTAESHGRSCQYWVGELAGKKVRLISCVTGKPVREGGWDLANKKPRELRGLVPAGSCYFLECDSEQDAKQVANAMQGAQWGQETAWGRGQCVVGMWA